MKASDKFAKKLWERGLPGTDTELRRRVEALEREVQECRALNVRLAELTDIVTELLLPVEARDEETLRRLLDKYRAEFF
jgi:hypothetical protein